MAYYKDLPIWRDAMRLAVQMEVAVRGSPRYHKHAPGEDRRLDRFFEATGIRPAVSAVVIARAVALALVGAVSPRWSRDDSEIAVNRSHRATGTDPEITLLTQPCVEQFNESPQAHLWATQI